MRVTSEDYYRVLLDLRPKGPAWSEDDDLLRGLSEGLARVHNRSMDLIEESDPRTTVEMIEDWERIAGLPDTCTGEHATTLEERRQAVVAVLTARGGQSVRYFRELAQNLGYDITITEHRPFICGWSQCGGEHQCADERIRFLWSVTVNGPRVTWFRCGVSECGQDHMAKLTRAEDLECLLHRYKPGHTQLTVGYQGA